MPLEQKELFEIVYDNRSQKLREYLRLYWAGKYKELELKSVFAFAAKFGLIEGQVLRIIEEEQKKAKQEKINRIKAGTWTDDDEYADEDEDEDGEYECPGGCD